MPSWVHPRIRGEYQVWKECREWVPGSPPHTRGIPPALSNGHSDLRFTPAYAGNTQSVIELNKFY